MDRSAPLRPDLRAIFRCLPRRPVHETRRCAGPGTTPAGVLAELATRGSY